MTATLASGLTIIPSEFLPHVVEYSTKNSALIQSGIVIRDSVFDDIAKQGGKTVTMPFWKDVDQDSQVVQDDADTTIYNISQSGDVAVKLMRENGWGASDLVAALAGDDPIDRLASMIGGYWARDDQRTLLKILDGVFADNADNDSSDLILDKSVADLDNATSDNYMSGGLLIDAKAKLGDAHGKLTAIAMHSVPFFKLEKAGFVEYVTAVTDESTPVTTTSTIQKPVDLMRNGIPTIFGRRVIVDDGITPVAVTGGYKYKTYLFGNGAFAMGEGMPKTPLEVFRTPLRGIDNVIYRRDFILHPRGIKFTSTTVTDETPSNANLALSANWDRVWDKKNIRMVQVLTNG